MSAEPDLFPHATAQAPELERARREAEAASSKYEAIARSYVSEADLIAAARAMMDARDRVTQLEAEAMRKEGR